MKLMLLHDEADRGCCCTTRVSGQSGLPPSLPVTDRATRATTNQRVSSATDNSAVSRTSLSTASLLWGHFRSEVQWKRLLLLRFCFPELTIFHACKYSAVSRTSLSTASLLWGHFRSEVQWKRLLLLRFCFPELTIFHACKYSAVSRTSLSTASLLWAQFRFKRVFLLLAFCKQNVSLQQLLSQNGYG